MLTTMRDHDTEDYRDLPDMDATDVGILGEGDRACLEDLGQYLVAAEGWQRFGIWLLHKHFEPEAGEVFVERALSAPRRTETTPTKKSTIAEHDLHTTALRFDNSVSNGVGVIGMEYARIGDFGDTTPLSEEDYGVLAGIAECLRSHDKMHRFGARLIRDPLGLSENELLHETCDSSQRTLQCSVGDRDTLLAEHTTIQTAWRWRAVQGTIDTIVMQDCTATCIRVGGGHDFSHVSSDTDNDDNPIEGEPNLPF